MRGLILVITPWSMAIKAETVRTDSMVHDITELKDEELNPFGVEIVDDPTIMITDVAKSVKVTAAYLKERYKDFGRGALGNFRYAIAGTERGYELGYPKDQGYLQAKVLTSGRYDPAWIRDPNASTGTVV